MRRYSLLIVSAILGVLFLLLYGNNADRFDVAEEMLKEHRAVALNADVDSISLYNVLTTHGYFAEDEASYVSGILCRKIKREGLHLTSLVDLNKRIWQLYYRDMVDTTYVKQGKEGLERSVNYKQNVPEVFRNKLNESRSAMGLDSEEFLALKTDELDSEVEVDDDCGVIEVQVVEKIEQQSLGDILLMRSERACEDVVVRLTRHDPVEVEGEWYDSPTVVAWAKTDEDGVARFTGLVDTCSYSVVPLREGYEYGSEKGTIGGPLKEVGDDSELECRFVQWDHRIRIFDSSMLQNIRADQTIVVRTPEEFKNQLVLYIVLFYAAWWLLSFLVNRKRRGADSGLIPIMMMLTGMCVLMMFSINNPLNDRLLGVEMAQGVLGGIVVIGLLQFIDFTKFYQDRLKIGFDFPMEIVLWFIKPFRRKVRYCAETLARKKSGLLPKLIALLCVVVSLPLLLLDLLQITRMHDAIEGWCRRVLPKGSGYLMLAILLTSMLFVFGSAVGGMKVNLNLFGLMFQPSEIAKYLIIFFMAAFFAVNADQIVRYSARGNIALFGSKMRMMGVIVVGLLALMGIYLALGDMGPALVLATTFIILYSIVKSKVDLTSVTDERTLLKRVLTCDLSMLFFGVGSFLLALWVGHLLGNMLIFCIAWFAVWIFVGYVRREVFESAILFNFIVVAFIFGSDILGLINPEASAAKRLESRVEMCTNTWGTLPIDGEKADPGENTQVAEGLWGLASGGFWGQGLGDGTPTFIPAFHTDMVLESIGEQLGFLGVLAVIVLLAMLMRRTILLGYRSSHPFTFYLCLGVAIVTAVQFVIITLGSTGIIPLTGITVPFFSFGKVSLILNLAAYGVITSISSHSALSAEEESAMAEARQQNIGKYNYSVAVLSAGYIVVAGFIAAAFFNFMVIDRDDILVRPVYVNSRMGVPVVQYNPRIAQITSRMNVGNIYDRNGLLLATSDRDDLKGYKAEYEKLGLATDNLSKLVLSRYYPFGDDLFFMLGDYNTGVYFGSETHGYMAESRHQDYLRGYNNRMTRYNPVTDKSEPVKVDLHSEEYAPGLWYSATKSYHMTQYQVRDYSDLLPYLKSPSKVEALNRGDKDGEIVPKDIHLTLDATLQKRLQDTIAYYMKNTFPVYKGRGNKPVRKNLSRVSVVVMDAEQGDLLASAMWPLPNQQQLSNPDLPSSYSDNYVDAKRWNAYTDVDLGLFRQLHPGSTAKVISSLAAIQKLGNDVTTDEAYTYDISPIQFVGLEPAGLVDMKTAIVKSSNCYYIHLINEHNAYAALLDIYDDLGMELYGHPSYNLFYSDEHNTLGIDEYALHTEEAVTQYERYMKKYDPYATQKEMDMDDHILWNSLWGHYPLKATPLAMARLTAAVVNGGEMPVTRYLLSDKEQSVAIVNPEFRRGVKNLETFMRQEAYEKFTGNSGDSAEARSFEIGGKTGTATHEWRSSKGAVQGDGWNDSWFICFAEFEGRTVAITVRIERGGSSSNAVHLTKNAVLGVMNRLSKQRARR